MPKKCPRLVFKSYCSNLVLFKEKLAPRVVLNTCVERLQSIYQLSSLAILRRLAVKVKRYITLILFLFNYFYIAIVHSSIVKPVLDIYEDENSPK